MDPFDNTSGVRRLDEGSLVELNTSSSSSASGNAAPPRPPKATSLPSLLSMLQNEFDAVLLELYDTRKVLEETRRELSSALYQNDAAVRVVARVVKERDEARMKLEEYLSSDASKQREMAAAAAGGEAQKRGRDDENEGGGTAKKAKVDDTTIEQDVIAEQDADLSKIPSSELEAMQATWKVLTKGRKAIAKLKRTEDEIIKNEKILSDLSAKDKEKKVNLGKSNAKAGVLCIKTIKVGDAEYIVTGSHDKTAIVYNVTNGQIVTTLSGAGGVINVVDALGFDDSMLVATGCVDGTVTLCSVPLSGDDESTILGSVKLTSTTKDDAFPIKVTIHPSSTASEGRVLVGSSDGKIELYKSSGEGGELKLFTRLESKDEGTKYTTGCMHPDGFIYIAGRSDGSLEVWDLKTQSMAGKLTVSFILKLLT